MLRSLKEVQADDSVIGFYQATTLGAFFNQTLVDTQAIHQEKLRHGGIVIVHGPQTFYILLWMLQLIGIYIRCFANRPWKCFVPCLPVDCGFHGGVQKIQLQHEQVRWSVMDVA
jgi:hypothetical protein